MTFFEAALRDTFKVHLLSHLTNSFDKAPADWVFTPLDW